jgi:hypothetical protein
MYERSLIQIRQLERRLVDLEKLMHDGRSTYAEMTPASQVKDHLEVIRMTLDYL